MKECAHNCEDCDIRHECWMYKEEQVYMLKEKLDRMYVEEEIEHERRFQADLKARGLSSRS